MYGRSNGWRSRTEITKGGPVRRMWEIYYLVSMRCWGIQPFQKNSPFQRRTGKATKMKFTTYRHQKIKDAHLMMPWGQACHSSWKGNQSLSLELLWMSATPTVFHANQRDETITLTTNASLKRLACGENLLHLQGG